MTQEIPSNFKTVLIDADSILYKCLFNTEEKRYFVDEPDNKVKEFLNEEDAVKYASSRGLLVRSDKVLVGSLEDAITDVEQWFGSIKSNTGARYSFAYIGGDGENFRDTVGTIKEYKGNRKGGVRPILLGDLKESLIKRGLLRKSPPSLEADDWTLAEFKRLKELDGVNEVVLAAIDKDAKQEYGYHYNYTTCELTYISKVQALINFYTQLLTGDSTDNILGLFGIGPKSKTVKDLQGMSNEDVMFFHVYDQYCKRFGNYGAKFMLENWRLLYMCRTEDIEDGTRAFYDVYNRVILQGVNDEAQ